MKYIFTILILIFFSNQSFSQDKFFCPTYVYEGFIKIDKEEKLEIKLNFLILLDSTLVGSYYYKPENGSLKLVGKLNNDNTFNLVERDKSDNITGIFNGKISNNKTSVSGLWSTLNKEKEYLFELNQVIGNSYWDFIQKNRALFEYNNLKQAMRNKDKVLSIDVANQGINKLPEKLNTLKKIVSINLLGNKFTEFPSILSKLTTLDEISLSTNKLTNIGAEIGELKNLRILIINNNQLTKLPKEIGDLTNLLYLEIGNNQLTSLPEEIKYLTSLQELHIERNKLSEVEKKRIKEYLPNCIIHF